MNEIKNHIIKALSKNIRYDERKLDEFRKVVVETGITKNAEGSAKVKIGETEVMAGVKLSIDKPFPDVPDEGLLMVNTELLPLSSPEFEAGPPGEKSIEISRVVDRGIRESKMLDLKKLLVEKDEKAWMISIDIVTINHAGNILDAAALATVAALKNTRMPEFDGTSIDYKKLTNKKLPISKTPISVTVIKIGDFFLVDPTEEEQSVLDARLTVAADGDTICAMQKGGNSPISTQDVNNMVGLAMTKSKELLKKIE